MSPSEFSPKVGVLFALADDLRLVLAPNPSPMTYLGTNTYLLGTEQIAVIDPGPDDDAHLQAILNAAAPANVSHIIVTHAHLDHSPLARRLSHETGAPIYGFGPADKGRSAIMQTLAKQGLAGGGEGIDAAFVPDIIVADGDEITGADWSLRAMHTPGHIGNHLSFIWKDTVFSGDHVMGWASSLVSPPDGDLTDFLASCARLKQINARCMWPGHGAPVLTPNARIDWLVAHRAERTAQILDALGTASRTVDDITQRVYLDLDPALLPAAKRNVFAHLVSLSQAGKIVAMPMLSIAGKFTKKN